MDDDVRFVAVTAGGLGALAVVVWAFVKVFLRTRRNDRVLYRLQEQVRTGHGWMKEPQDPVADACFRSLRAAVRRRCAVVRQSGGSG
jgi:hypothetical protein